jgi:hypothetical protein
VAYRCCPQTRGDEHEEFDNCRIGIVRGIRRRKGPGIRKLSVVHQKETPAPLIACFRAGSNVLRTGAIADLAASACKTPSTTLREVRSLSEPRPGRGTAHASRPHLTRNSAALGRTQDRDRFVAPWLSALANRSGQIFRPNCSVIASGPVAALLWPASGRAGLAITRSLT